MEQMTKAEVVEILLARNDKSMTAQVAMYASAFVGYLEAEKNIEEKGTIVAHPRTGSPIENPYLKIRADCMKEMRGMPLIEGTSVLWKRAGLV